MNGTAQLPPETVEMLAMLRAQHPSFGRVADLLTDLAFDESVSAVVYDRVCDAIFTVLTVWRDEVPA